MFFIFLYFVDHRKIVFIYLLINIFRFHEYIDMWKELIIYGILNILEPKIVSELSLLQQQQGTVLWNNDIFFLMFWISIRVQLGVRIQKGKN